MPIGQKQKIKIIKNFVRTFKQIIRNCCQNQSINTNNFGNQRKQTEVVFKSLYDNVVPFMMFMFMIHDIRS